MARRIHPVAGALAFVTIAFFWLSTAISELLADVAVVTTVKTAIPYGLLLLIPAIAAAGGSGFALAGGAKTGLVTAKARRMPVVAANGVLILVPAALFLAAKAKAGAFDAQFYAVQAVELVAGATNLALLGLNIRDGLRLSGRQANPEARATTLLGRDVVADGTIALRFAKPAGFTHQAGQHIALSLPDQGWNDARGLTRTLTLASAPEDADLVVATRLGGSAFKRAAQALAVGATAQISRPRGELILEEGVDRPVVCLAGGVGVTPFRAMIRHAALAGRPHRITLFYACRRPADAAFLDELRGFAEAGGRFRLVATVSEPTPEWRGETGPVSREMLARHLGDAPGAIYYLAGPPALTKALREILAGAGVAARDIRAEDFSGA